MSPVRPTAGLRFAVRHQPDLLPAGEGNGSDPGRARLRIDIFGTTRAYQALGEYFLALSRLDSDGLGEFREDFEDLLSADGGTRLHVVVRQAYAIRKGLRPT